jgi:hypothetical protein
MALAAVGRGHYNPGIVVVHSCAAGLTAIDKIALGHTRDM